MNAYLMMGILATGAVVVFGYTIKKNEEIKKIKKGHGYTIDIKNEYIEQLRKTTEKISKKYEDLTSEHYEIEEMSMRQSEENIYLRSENKRLKEEAQRMREEFFWRARK